MPILVLGVSLATAATVSADEGISTLSTLGTPARAALLNAGTVYTGLAADGRVGLGIEAVSPIASASNAEVAGVQVGDDVVSAHTLSTTGAPSLAALLNMGTAMSGLGPTGSVGGNIVAFTG